MRNWCCEHHEVLGHECLSHIDGDFALVIWDARRQEAFCARDRMGNKPFTYYWTGKTLYFASEQQAILRQPEVTQLLNEDVVAEYLAAQWFSNSETLWQGILRLAAAHTMVVTPSGPSLNRYWAPDLQASLSFRSDQECAEYYRTLLFDVVRRLPRSIHPIACEVSGGLDSSAIFAVAETLRRESWNCARQRWQATRWISVVTRMPMKSTTAAPSGRIWVSSSTKLRRLTCRCLGIRMLPFSTRTFPTFQMAEPWDCPLLSGYALTVAVSC